MQRSAPFTLSAFSFLSSQSISHHIDEEFNHIDDPPILDKLWEIKVRQELLGEKLWYKTHPSNMERKTHIFLSGDTNGHKSAEKKLEFVLVLQRLSRLHPKK